MVGINRAVDDYLDENFREFDHVGKFIYLGPLTKCDEVVDVFVVGDMGSGETAYSCNICLQNDGGIATVSSSLSACYRD